MAVTTVGGTTTVGKQAGISPISAVISMPVGFCLGNSKSSIIYLGWQEDVVNGNPSPSLYAPCKGIVRRIAYLGTIGSHTISVDIKQPSNLSPRPTLTVKANPDIGINADVTASAGSGAGWVTITVTVSPTSPGAVYVEVSNNLWQRQDCWIDNLVAS